MLSLINKWLSLAFKKYNKEMPRSMLSSAQAHCTIPGLHHMFDMSHVYWGSLWILMPLGPCVFPLHFHMVGAALHRQDASCKLLPARNRCPWACFLCSFTALVSLHIWEAPFLEHSNSLQYFFLFPSFFFSLGIAKYVFCLDIHGVFNGTVPKRENMY